MNDPRNPGPVPDNDGVPCEPFSRCLDMSTAHVSPTARELLDDANGMRQAGVRAVNHEHGWTVYVRGEWDDEYAAELRESGWPEDFITILKYAADHSVLLLNFDQDADMYADWPTFDY